VWAGGENTAVRLTGPFFHSGQPGQVDFSDDSFNVGFVPLDPDQVSELPGVVYLSEETIETGLSSTSAGQYLAVGFIANDSTPSASQGQLTVKGTGIMALEAPTERYAQRGATRETHLLLSFDRRRTFSEKRAGRDSKDHGYERLWNLATTSSAFP
jgi:hypothetical protein